MVGRPGEGMLLYQRSEILRETITITLSICMILHVFHVSQGPVKLRKIKNNILSLPSFTCMKFKALKLLSAATLPVLRSLPRM